jgi:hypothetical protein
MSESNLDLNRCFYAFVTQTCLLLAVAFCLWLGTAIKKSARTPRPDAFQQKKCHRAGRGGSKNPDPVAPPAAG